MALPPFFGYICHLVACIIIKGVSCFYIHYAGSPEPSDGIYEIGSHFLVCLP